MVFLFDENCSFRMADGLNALEDGNTRSDIKITVTHPKHCGLSGKSDEEIIEYAGKHQATIFTQDKDFKHIKHYYQLYKTHKVGVIILRSYKGQIQYWDNVQRLIKHWEEIKSLVKTTPKPFVYEIHKTGISQLHF